MPGTTSTRDLILWEISMSAQTQFVPGTAPQTTAQVVIEALVKKYGALSALNGVSFDIARANGWR